jgi:transposase-like protein
MSQYAVERKESTVRRLLPPENASIRRLARESGISESTLYLWRLKARAQGGSVEKEKSSGKASAARRLAAVVETFSFNEAELAEYCRKKGLYPEQVRRWRAAAEQAIAGGMVPTKEHRATRTAEKKRIKELERELRRKERALAETAALLTLRKKAAAIWGEAEDA